jgi:hypothetical protein
VKFSLTSPGTKITSQVSMKTRIFVQPDGDNDMFLEPTQYHSEHTLVYRVYGSDLLDRLHQYGFSVCRLQMAIPEWAISVQDSFLMCKGGYVQLIST